MIFLVWFFKIFEYLIFWPTELSKKINDKIYKDVSKGAEVVQIIWFFIVALIGTIFLGNFLMFLINMAN